MERYGALGYREVRGVRIRTTQHGEVRGVRIRRGTGR